MKSTPVIVILAMIICFGFATCGENEDTTACSLAWGTELQSEINAITAAAQAYGANQSVANCAAWKNAAQAYLTALEPYGDCATLTTQQRSSWQSARNSAQQSVDAITCEAPL